MKREFQNGGGWLQITGGLTVLLVVPALTVLCLSPEVHNWIRASMGVHLRPDNTGEKTKDAGDSERMKQYRLPNSIAEIAQVSEAEPDFSKTTPAQSSDASRAILRLHRALEAYPKWNTRDVFRAVNEKEATAQNLPCPFERIDGEQSIVLGAGKHGDVSLAKTLNRCAEAVEQLGVLNRSAR